MWSGRHRGLPSLFPSLLGSRRLREFQWLPFRISPLPLLEGARPGRLSLPGLLVPGCTCGQPRGREANVPTCAGWTEPAPPVLACLDACFCTPPWTRTPISRTCGRAAAGRPASPFPKAHQYLLTFGFQPQILGAVDTCKKKKT